MIVSMVARMHAHPDVESYTLYQNEWGGYTVRFTLRGQDLDTSGDEADEALALALAHIWGDDA